MSLIDKLMAIDSGEFAKGQSEEITAKRLSEVLGEPTKVKVMALSGDQYMDITTRLVDKRGNADFSKSYDVNALLVVEGMVEPSLKDKELQKHFGAATPKELAKVLFPGGELTEVANVITRLSGFSTSDTEDEEEIKN
ncbi:MAG TPA: hypothetical protein DEV97_06010 [Lachnospiraceae bacterium]|nr:hypothetical protein [Lachnospiraceae bacterium]